MVRPGYVSKRSTWSTVSNAVDLLDSLDIVDKNTLPGENPGGSGSLLALNFKP